MLLLKHDIYYNWCGFKARVVLMENSIFCSTYLPLLGKTVTMKTDIDAKVCAKLKAWKKKKRCLSRLSKKGV